MSTKAVHTYTTDDFKLNDARSHDKFQPKVRRSSKRLAKKKLQKEATIGNDANSQLE